MTDKSSVEAWLTGLGAPSADRDYKPGHERMNQLLADMQLHRPGLRIRIAGTNGKGSTAHMLAAGLQAAGLKVGLYTSPHIHSFNERIRISGRPVADDLLLALLPPIVERAMHIGASYFEVATALALQCFSDAAVDVEVLEAGVGARLDASTAVDADMALLTPVALDHQAWLGDALADIAAEKAHVFDACRWRISAAQTADVRQVLDRVADDICYIEAFEPLQLAMPGGHQQANAALALTALHTLSAEGRISLTQQDARAALSTVTVPGRLQRIASGGQCFWLDAAHNRHAVEALLPTLKGMPPFDTLFVFTREDRDLRDALPLLRPLARRLISSRDDARADAVYASIEQALAGECPVPCHGMSGDVQLGQGGRYLVLGSFITVAAAEDWLAARQ